jgi:hypothetical protein
MGQVFHGSARTTEAVRRTIQNRQESMRALARRYGINPKTVRKWKCRCSTVDAPMGPKIPSTPSSPRRLPLCHASHYPASNTLVAPPLSAAPGCPKSKAKKHPRKNSRPTRSASSTSTSPRSGPKKADSTSSSPSIALRSLPLQTPPGRRGINEGGTTISCVPATRSEDKAHIQSARLHNRTAPLRNDRRVSE